MTVALIQNSILGANPFVVDGPFTSGTGYPAANFTLGSEATGDMGSEWVYVTYTPGSTGNLLPGTVFNVDKDFTATLCTTAAATRGQWVGVFHGYANYTPNISGVLQPVSLTSGSQYYLWLQRAGQAPVSVSTATAAVVMETTSTAGTLNAPSSATVGSKFITSVTLPAASKTFTATTVSGSAVLTGLSGASLRSGPFLGATLNGTGISGLTVSSITTGPSGVITSITMSGNASASNAGVTVTATGILEGTWYWPLVDKTN